MRIQITLLVVSLLAVAPRAGAEVGLQLPESTSTPPPDLALSQTRALRCDSCTAMKVSGAMGLLAGELGAMAHVGHVWKRDARPIGFFELLLGGEYFATEGAAVLELVPVVGPLGGAVFEPDAHLRNLLLVDAGVEAASLTSLYLGSRMEKRWKVQVVPVATRSTAGVQVAARF